MSIIEQIKAEIERRIEAHHTHGHFCAEHEFRDVLSFISTLEQEKPVPNDLEGAAKEYTGDSVSDEGIMEVAAFIAGAKWDRERMMSKAVEGWVAVDSDTYGKRRVTLFPKKPVRDVLTEYKYWAATCPRYESIKLDSNAFPNLKWEDEPKKVKLIIIEED